MDWIRKVNPVTTLPQRKPWSDSVRPKGPRSQCPRWKLTSNKSNHPMKDALRIIVRNLVIGSSLAAILAFSGVCQAATGHFVAEGLAKDVQVIGRESKTGDGALAPSGTGNLPGVPKPPPELPVFITGKEGYPRYRIPAGVVTTKGTLLAFCEGRTGGDSGDIDIVLKRSTDGGKTWGPLQVVWNDGGNTCGNPAPVVDLETGTIWLLLTWNLGTDHERTIMAGTSKEVRHVYVTHSDDDGLTWAKPERISDTTRQPHWRWYATGPVNGIQLTRGAHKGRLLIPANHSDHSQGGHPYRSHVIYSDDHGKSWKLGGIEEDRTNESSVAELSDGSVLQAMRSYHGKNRRAMAVSRDGGSTWGKVYLDQALDTPVCQASLLRFSWPENAAQGGKSRLLFASPAGSTRARMTVWLSYDEGKTWPVHKLVHGGASAYSNLLALPDGRIGLLYEKDGYKTITLATFDLAWLE